MRKRPKRIVPVIPPQEPIRGEWWGVVGPLGMPCLFGKSRDDVEGQADNDERIALFRVEEVDPV